jgi:hypothetical protein
MHSLFILPFFIYPVFCVPALPSAPEGCRKLNTDSDWPSSQVWNQALPRASRTGGPALPDYRFRARTAADVEKAVKFAADNNLRITIITAGHDYLGRNNAPSGLSLDLSLLKGVRLLENFTPTVNGAHSALSAKTNVISPKVGSRPAVTFGVGMATQPLNDAIRVSKVFTLGAAHGM